MSDPRFQLVNVLPDDVAMGGQDGGMSDAAYMARDPHCTCPPSASYSATHVEGCPLRFQPLQLATCDGCGQRWRVPRATDSIGCPTVGCPYVLRRHEHDDETAPVMASEAERLLVAMVQAHSEKGFIPDAGDGIGDWARCVLCDGIAPHHRDETTCPVNLARRYLLARGLLTDGE